MPFRSQRNVTVSAGDAAVLIRAMNRRRPEDETPRAEGRAEVVAASSGRSTRGRSPRSGGIGASPSRASLQAVSATARPAGGLGRVRSPRASEPAGGRSAGPSRSVAGRSPRADLRVVGSESSDGRRSDRTSSRPPREARTRPARPSHERREGRTGGVRGLAGSVLEWFVGLSSRAHVALAVVAGLVAFVAFFYGPTADLYAAYRDHTQLVAKVEATKAVASDLEERVHRLQTEEGIMDEARIRGYANPGEVAVDASGLLGIEDTVTVPELSKPIETEEPSLAIRMLDVLMGYEERVS